MKPIGPSLILLCTALMAANAFGRTDTINNPNVPDGPEWQEVAVTSAPAFSSAHLLPLEMLPPLSVSIGLDPDTIRVDKDGVVRYVVVMTSRSGSTSAFFEGIRCSTREVKTYARHGSSGDWIMTTGPVWRALNDTMPSHHAMAFARQGACVDGAFTRDDILNAMKNGPTQPTDINKY